MISHKRMVVQQSKELSWNRFLSFEADPSPSDFKEPYGSEGQQNLTQQTTSIVKETGFATKSLCLHKEMNGKLDDLTEKISQIQINTERAKERDISKEEIWQEGVAAKNDTMHTCLSLEDIVKNFREIRYEEKIQALVCSVCLQVSQTLSGISTEINRFAVFKFNETAGDGISHDEQGPHILRKKFRNLKRHLNAHLRSKKHIKALDKIIYGERELERHDSWERSVGIRIGRVFYYMFKLERPDTGFKPLIYIHY